ncbi:hypothetical protein THER_0194 [Thermodesulfovibrio sp. N1]|uniref:hypothetical protein n=1 Tax=unclassified Thermodesulfovibrio TaxID=2645936 RepID=UPI00083B4004|nr:MULTISPECIES: hypothetical protein [unclassified Thermodesulfovibrio]MDI1472135.1 hypothetical protein [Thermodesulfovibrio sp. 1176]ODA45115.1 hypothetical protein THER_0194 [Thermodesulfovibrio sp. N1]
MAADKKHLTWGLILLVSFVGVLILIFAPIYGEGMNGLEYSDELFNKLSKGSAYQIPKLKKDVEKYKGKPLDVVIDVKKSGDKPGDAEKRAERIAKVMTINGAKAEVDGSKVHITADFGALMAAALEDADQMYKNNGDYIKKKYDVTDDEKMKQMFRQWHNALSLINKRLTLDKKAEDANFVKKIMTAAIEPAYNFYGIDAVKISEKAGLAAGLLGFYVLYTIWYGFGVLYLFEGLGLSTKKAKVKKEV